MSKNQLIPLLKSQFSPGRTNFSKAPESEKITETSNQSELVLKRKKSSAFGKFDLEDIKILQNQIQNVNKIKKIKEEKKQFALPKDRKFQNAEALISALAPQKFVNHIIKSHNFEEGKGGLTPMQYRKTPLLKSRKRMWDIKNAMEKSTFLREINEDRKSVV